ncbi:helix-turn-helix domain-containing protein [Pseudomonas syringae]|nr:helix-turn-helix domain-containing protein [Pseudomonas syringae]MBD8811730.1 helix-turn-helix domain-containing protein [Pseudomonas syringae]
MNVAKMLEQLQAEGWSQARIAERCCTSQPTIHRITKGGDTRYEVGKAIEKLHQEVTSATDCPSSEPDCLLDGQLPKGH